MRSADRYTSAAPAVDIIANGSLALPATTTDYFGDDNDSIFEDNINAIAAAGITVGTGPDTYSPELPVTRAQMATFLARGLGIGS